MKGTQELTDAVNAYKGGSADAFDVIYDQSYRYLYVCIHSVIGNEEDSQDLLQETYLDIAKGIENLRDAEAFLSWAGRIASRKCAAYISKNQQEPPLETADALPDDLAADEDFIPENIMQDKETQRLIRELIDKLSPMQRLCIINYYYNGLKQEEIAQDLGIPLNSVKSHILRAKAKIKDGVLSIEKEQGTRLYSIAPLLLLLFDQDVAQCALPDAIKGNVLTGVKALAKAAGGGAKAAGLALKTKAAIGAAAAVVLVGGGILLYQTGALADLGIGHTHTWTEATCLAPMTCTECGKTEGELADHVWNEATCEAPMTCSVCGITQGEALPHTWTDATCTQPKTCSVCGATEGEPLEHQFAEANYQSPAVCTVCGATEGEPLQADFDAHGLQCNAQLNVVYPYETLTYHNKDVHTVGTVEFSNYRIVASDEEHEALEGYEWRCVDLTFIYSDDNAWEYGTTSSPFSTDYYTCKPAGTSGDGKDESDVGVMDFNNTYTVNYRGIDYTECQKEDHALVMEWNNHVYTCQIRFSFRVPIGYDGTVVGAISDGKYNDGDYIYEVADADTLLFRLD